MERLMALLLCLLLIEGCVPAKREAKASVESSSVPPLPIGALLSEGRLSGLEVVPPPFVEGKKSVTLAWDNLAATNAARLVTGLWGSTNLRDWYPVVEIPYTTSVYVTITDRPPFEFYRAYNRTN